MKETTGILWNGKEKNGKMHVCNRQTKSQKKTETFSYDESLLSSVVEQIVVYHEYARR